MQFFCTINAKSPKNRSLSELVCKLSTERTVRNGRRRMMRIAESLHHYMESNPRLVPTLLRAERGNEEVRRLSASDQGVDRFEVGLRRGLFLAEVLLDDRPH